MILLINLIGGAQYPPTHTHGARSSHDLLFSSYSFDVFHHAPLCVQLSSEQASNQPVYRSRNAKKSPFARYPFRLWISPQWGTSLSPTLPRMSGLYPSARASLRVSPRPQPTANLEKKSRSQDDCR